MVTPRKMWKSNYYSLESISNVGALRCSVFYNFFGVELLVSVKMVFAQVWFVRWATTVIKNGPLLSSSRNLNHFLYDNSHN